MKYPYSAVNRLDEPHTYMYAPYAGIDLLESYVIARRESLERSKGAGVEDERWVDSARPLDTHSIDSDLETAALLGSIIQAQVAGGDEALLKSWLDRLAQRFEVTKKLFESYPPGFRKGVGSYRHVRTYWMFALALSLEFARSGSLKFLSTLIKVNDLLCSLPASEICEVVPEGGIDFVVGTEMKGVRSLAARQGVPFAAD